MGNLENVEEQAAAGAVKPGAPPGQADVLAREARSNAIHCPTPCCTVKGE